MKLTTAYLVPAIAVLTVAIALPVSASPQHEGDFDRVSLAQVGAEQARQRALDIEMAPIKSADELAAYLHDADAASPLMTLTPAARERFLASLEFNKGGLVSYQYDDLARELTASQAYRLLTLFGAQRTTYLLGARVENGSDEAVSVKPRVPNLMADHVGYKCLSPHNCYYSEFYICLTGC